MCFQCQNLEEETRRRILFLTISMFLSNFTPGKKNLGNVPQSGNVETPEAEANASSKRDLQVRHQNHFFLLNLHPYKPDTESRASISLKNREHCDHREIFSTFAWPALCRQQELLSPGLDISRVGLGGG